MPTKLTNSGGRVKRTFRLVRVLFGGGLVCLVGAVSPHTSAAERYPWDTRAEACFSEPHAASPRCTLVNWPTFDETVQRVTSLYQSEAFPLLERALAELAASRER